MVQGDSIGGDVHDSSSLPKEKPRRGTTGALLGCFDGGPNCYPVVGTLNFNIVCNLYSNRAATISGALFRMSDNGAAARWLP